MKSKPLGTTTDKLPEIGIGTWKMGANPLGEIAALKKGFELGMKFVDTAELYGTERIVGDALKGSNGIFVATKVSPSHFGTNEIERSCNASLNNLGLDRLDLYQLHWPNNRIPIKQTMAAMEGLVDQGKIRHIGVSNFDINELAEAQGAMAKYEIASNQVEYSVLVRGIEDGLLEFCNQNKVTIIAYSPLGTGALYSARYAKTRELLERIGNSHAKTITQVALNWLISKKGVVAIPKASSEEHVVEIAGASGWKMSKSENEEIDALVERKSALAGGIMKPILKNTSLWASAMQIFNEKRTGSNQKSKTTKSSKK